MKNLMKRMIMLLSVAAIVMLTGIVSQADPADGEKLFPDEIRIYCVNSVVEEVVGSPGEDQPTSYALSAGDTGYKLSWKFIEMNGDVDITRDGVIEPSPSYIVNGQGGSMIYYYPPEHYDEIEYYPGTAVLRVYYGDMHQDIKITLVELGRQYAEDRIQAVYDQCVEGAETDMEKLSAFTRWVAENTIYNVKYQKWQDMMLYNCGDCWASTDTICKLCNMAGIDYMVDCSDSHRCPMVKIDGKYYLAEASYYETTLPRSYDISETQPFRLGLYGNDTYNKYIFSYCGIDEDVIIPYSYGFNIIYGVGYDDGSMFYSNSRNITGVALSKGLKAIRGGALIGGKDINNVYIPDSVISIGEKVFLNSYITDVYYEGTEEQWNAIEGISGEPIGSKAGTVTVHFSQAWDESIKKIIHHWDRGVVTKEATCTVSGNKVYHCKDCDKVRVDYISEKEHDLELIDSIPAACTTDGNYEYWKCRDCGKMFSTRNRKQEMSAEDIIKPAHGHSVYHYEAKAATPTRKGNIEYWKCNFCGLMFADKELTTEVTDIYIQYEYTQPVNPTDPEDPVNPVNPVDPVNPVNPEDPVEPVNPEDPEKPVNPDDPVNPVDPVNPDDPVNPVDPVTPEEPTEPTDTPSPLGPDKADLTKYKAGADVLAVKSLKLKKTVFAGVKGIKSFNVIDGDKAAIKIKGSSLKVQKSGKITIAALDAKGETLALKTVTVEVPEVDKAQITEIGRRGNLDLNTYIKASVKPESWKSSSRKIAEVDKDGLLKIKKSGTVRLTVTFPAGKGMKAKKLTIKLKIKMPQFSRSKYSVKVGKSVNTAVMNANPSEITYRIENEAVASVDAKGRVTGVSPGSTKLIMTVKQIDYETLITVR